MQIFTHNGKPLINSDGQLLGKEITQSKPIRVGYGSSRDAEVPDFPLYIVTGYVQGDECNNPLGTAIFQKDQLAGKGENFLVSGIRSDGVGLLGFATMHESNGWLYMDNAWTHYTTSTSPMQQTGSLLMTSIGGVNGIYPGTLSTITQEASVLSTRDSGNTYLINYKVDTNNPSIITGGTGYPYDPAKPHLSTSTPELIIPGFSTYINSTLSINADAYLAAQANLVQK